MTNRNQELLTRTLASIALAIAMILSGPVFHIARHTALPKPQLTNETVIFKQQLIPAAGVDDAPLEAAAAS